MTNWQRAIHIAEQVEVGQPTRVGLGQAVGCLLAQPVAAFGDLPAQRVAAASGWAVVGIGPWQVVAPDSQIMDGQAVPIKRHQPLPEDAVAVVAQVYGQVDHGSALPNESPDDARPILSVLASDGTWSRPGRIDPGVGVIEPGTWARQGDPLLKSGQPVTAGSLALAVTAGADDLFVIPPPTVAVVLRQEGYLTFGPSRRSKNRDPLAEVVSSWAMAAGARSLPEVSANDDARELAATIERAGADFVIVTAPATLTSEAVLLEALKLLGAEILVDKLACQPAATGCLAELRDGRRLLALPPEPDYALTALTLLVSPSIATMAGRGSTRNRLAMLRNPVSPSPQERLIPAVLELGELADLVDVKGWYGPNGLGSFGEADVLAVIAPGKGRANESIPVLPIAG